MVLPSLVAGVSLKTVSVGTGSVLLGMLETGFPGLEMLLQVIMLRTVSPFLEVTL